MFVCLFKINKQTKKPLVWFEIICKKSRGRIPDEDTTKVLCGDYSEHGFGHSAKTPPSELVTVGTGHWQNLPSDWNPEHWAGVCRAATTNERGSEVPHPGSPGEVAHTWNPTTQEIEARGFRVQDQPLHFYETLSQNNNNPKSYIPKEWGWEVPTTARADSPHTLTAGNPHLIWFDSEKWFKSGSAQGHRASNSRTRIWIQVYLIPKPCCDEPCCLCDSKLVQAWVPLTVDCRQSLLRRRSVHNFFQLIIFTKWKFLFLGRTIWMRQIMLPSIKEKSGRKESNVNVFHTQKNNNAG